VHTAVVAAEPEAVELRQNSPFTGVIPAHERQAVLASFAAYWQHSAA